MMSVSMLLLGAYIRDSVTQTVYDDATNLTWQDDVSVKNANNKKDWSEAIAYCEALDVAGVQDWRLPNVNSI